MKERRARIVEIARRLRKSATKPERLLWWQLRPSRCGWPRFRRQHPVRDRYVVDFCCIEARLVIEVDGKLHDEQAERDAARQKEIESLGWHVVRISAEAVLRDPPGIARGIVNLARRRMGAAEIDSW